MLIKYQAWRGVHHYWSSILVFCFVDTGSLNATLIKNRVKINEKTLFEELEPAAIVSALSKTNVYPKSALDRVCEPRSCFKQFQRLLAMVEEGSLESVEGFVTVLSDLGYSEIVKLITAPDLENKSGKVTFIFFSFDNDNRHKRNIFEYNLSFWVGCFSV